MAIMNNYYKVLLYKNFKNNNDARYEWSCHVLCYYYGRSLQTILCVYLNCK